MECFERRLARNLVKNRSTRVATVKFGSLLQRITTRPPTTRTYSMVMRNRERSRRRDRSARVERKSDVAGDAQQNKRLFKQRTKG